MIDEEWLRFPILFTRQDFDEMAERLIAAGRARGIEEERKRAVKIARDVSIRADAAMIERRRHGFRVDNHQERDTADAIADAIAKGGTT